MKLTIKDIANLAKVSTTTVSKIINNKDQNISEATRKRVKDIMEEHNYIPSSVARGLVTKKTYTIGLVMPDITNPFFPELARGAEDKASELGYSLIICNTDGKVEKEKKYINMLAEKRVDGIIFTAGSNPKQEESYLENLKIPIVLLDRNIDIESVNGSIFVDNKYGGYEAVDHLIKSGYKNIGHIMDSSSKTAEERYMGYVEALQDYDMKVDEEMVAKGEYTVDFGYEGAKMLIEKNKEIDSIFCGNDLIAIGAIKYLKERGIEIPKQVGIVGFDDIYISKYLDPELTTISQPNYKMGYKAVEIIEDIINNPNHRYCLTLKPELVVRKSTKNFLKEDLI